MVLDDGPVTFAFRVVGVEDCGGASSQHFLVVQRTARLAGSIRREAAYEAPVFCEELNSCGRDGRVGRGSSEQLLAAGSNRGRLMPSRSDAGRAARAEPWSDRLTANPGQRLTVPDSLTALTALSLTV